MATTTDELILKVKVDAEKQKLDLLNTELAKLKGTSTAADAELRKLENSVKRAEERFQAAQIAIERKNRALKNVNDSIVSSSVVFGKFGGVLGQVSGQIVQMGNQFEDLQYQAKRAGSTFDPMTASLSQATKEMGGLGVAALAVSAAMGGWQVGTWLNGLTSMTTGVKAFDVAIRAALLPVIALQKAASTLGDISVGGFGIDMKKVMTEVPGSKDTQAKFQAAKAEEKRLLMESEAGWKAWMDGVKQRQDDVTDNFIKSQAKITAEGKKTTAELIRLKEEERKFAEKVAQDQIEIMEKKDAAMRKIAIEGMLFEIKSDQERAEHLMNTEDAYINELLADRYNAIQEEKAMLKELAEYEKQLYLDRIGYASDFFSQLGSMIGGIAGQGFDMISNSLNSFGAVMEKVLNHTEGAFGASLSAVNAWAAGIGTALSQVGQAIGGTAGGIASAAGSIAMGFAMGGPWGAAIAAVGEMIKVLIKAFQHDWKADSQNILETIKGITGVSAELQDEIAKLAEELGDAEIAVTMSLGKIIDEVGYTTETVAALRDVFALLDRGAIDASQAIEVLNDTFQQMADGSKDAFGLISPAMQEIIDLAERFGLEVQAITDFLNNELTSAANGVNDILTNSNIKTEASFLSLQGIVMDTFNSLIAQGFSTQEAFEMLGPSFDVLVEAMERLGLEGDAAFQELIKFQQLLDMNDKWIQKLNGVQAALAGLANAGALTQSSFAKLGNQADSVYARLIAGGMTSDQALAQMAPTLAMIQQLAAQYGFVIDKNTQALIDQAIAAGLLGDSTEGAVDPMIAGFESVVDAINNLTLALGGSIDQVGELAAATVTAAGQMQSAMNGVTGPSFGGGGGGFSPLSGANTAQRPSTGNTSGGGGRAGHMFNINLTGGATQADADMIKRTIQQALNDDEIRVRHVSR